MSWIKEVMEMPSEKLIELLQTGATRNQHELIVQELQRRGLIEIVKTTEELIAATSSVSADVQLLWVYSANVEKAVDRLIVETGKVHTEVSLLSSSSDRLERLTKSLKTLTLGFSSINSGRCCCSHWH
jgi:hypothetical protein